MVIRNLVYRTRFIMALLSEGAQYKRRPSIKIEPFEDYVDTVMLVYDFKGPADRPIRLIGDKNRVLLPIVTALSFYEFLKFAYNGIVNNNLHRLYLCDLVSLDRMFASEHGNPKWFEISDFSEIGDRSLFPKICTWSSGYQFMFDLSVSALACD